MRLILLLAALVVLGRPALAQPAPKMVPCASISPAAVTSVPAPFDAYMKLVCWNTSGQGLLPPAGTRWVDGNIDVGLTSMDDRPGADGQTHLSVDWYVSLTPRQISPGDEAKLRQVLMPALRPDFIEGANIIELEADTSAGQVKQEFIITPADPVATNGIKLLVECHVWCQGSDKPYILGIVPAGT
jgi:hypothetical protein